MEQPTVDELLEVAFHEVKKSRRCVTTMRYQAGFAWCRWRDALVQGWVDRILDRVSARRLIALYEVVSERLRRWGYAWESPDEEDVSRWVAHGLAILRWMNREMHGRVEIPDFDSEYVARFLERKTSKQLELFEREEFLTRG